MNVSGRFVLVLIMAAALSACQSEGPIPQEQGEVPDRLDDMTRDLLSVAAQVPQARQEFVEDLQAFADNGVGAHAAATFGGKLADAVTGAKLTETSARQLARTSWIAVSATELNARQVASTREQLKTQLASVGVPPERSEAAAAEVTTLQKVIGTRPRRWYELF
jgi:hypothetical protein